MTFLVRRKGAQIGRNPRTGEEVPIAPRRVVTFKASKHLKALVENSLIKLEENSNNQKFDIGSIREIIKKKRKYAPHFEWPNKNIKEVGVVEILMESI